MYVIILPTGAASEPAHGLHYPIRSAYLGVDRLHLFYDLDAATHRWPDWVQISATAMSALASWAVEQSVKSGAYACPARRRPYRDAFSFPFAGNKGKWYNVYDRK